MLRRTVPAVLIAGLAIAAVASCGGGAAAGPERHPPVVMILFDEFSSLSLLDKDGRVDAKRYPNFAAVAGDGTFFPYATASLDETGRAVRSLFTGKTHSEFAKPTYRNAKRNLFTLMAKGYRLNAVEEGTSLCPLRLCPGSHRLSGAQVRKRLASGRPERFARWVRSIKASRRPTFYFKHILIPHSPWVYLPSGHRYAEGRTEAGFSFGLEHRNRWLIDARYQRHLLQTAFTDRLLGTAIAKLKRAGIYDRAVILLCADNGESFGRVGNGHTIDSRNASDIALTPMILKLPGQTDARVVPRHVRTVDIVPTLLGLAHMKAPRGLEGRSMFGASARQIPSSTVAIERSGHRLRLSLGTLRSRQRAALRLKDNLFGAGLFSIGPSPALHGRPLSTLTLVRAGSTHAKLDAKGRYRNVRLGAFAPVQLTGRLTGKGQSKATNLAFAVNGRVVATAPTVSEHRGATQAFAAMIPEETLRDGANDVRIYAIVGGTRLRRLA